jgi:Ca2+-binding EF-hand superfamily protein
MLFLALAAAQASTPIEHRHYGRPFISPMGEPFRSKGAGDDPLADWFAQADRNHDGSVTVVEMEADADRFFALLDANHDGEIDPDEMDHYETTLTPEVRGEPDSLRRPKSTSPDEPAPDADTEIAEGLYSEHQGAGRFGLLDIPEPVASADTDFNRGVSRDEFRRAAINRFALLDTTHTGRLSLPQLEAMRPSSPLGGFGLGHHGGHRHGGPPNGSGN